jgi:hypothetical protein
VVFIPEKFLIRRFSVTDKKYVLKAFAIVSGFLVNLSFTFIVVILFVVFLLLVMVLTMFQVVFGILLDFNMRLLY